jgi:uracil-DNA glycosylase
VLLLNTVLTVRRGCPGSHAHQGWERLTAATVAAVAAKPEPVVFHLWGARAGRGAPDRHRRGAPHRPRLDASLAALGEAVQSQRARCVGSAPFRRANEELDARGQPVIEWDLGAA